MGGKTAIDLEHGKNLAGAFYQPRAVLCDLDTLDTLPEADFADGCAEVIKYGMIGDAGLLNTLETIDLRADPEGLPPGASPTSGTWWSRTSLTPGPGSAEPGPHHRPRGGGLRRLPDLPRQGGGHRHDPGDPGAVAAGLCPPEVLPRLEALLARYHLPTATDYAAADLYEKTLSDKKRAGDTLSLVVPTAWGRVCSTPSPWASCCPGSKGAGAMTVTLLPGPAQGTLAAIPPSRRPTGR